MNPRTKTHIDIVNVTLPEGPISIKRYDPSKQQSSQSAKPVSISTQMLARVANALLPGQPINFDRVLGGSYNTRSALEALLAHTPTFYACYPGRLDSYSGKTKAGHKHLLWLPELPHQSGVIVERQTDIVISELPMVDLAFESLAVPDTIQDAAIDIDIQRQHARIQIALVMIGIQLGYRCWVAQNDRGILYDNQRVGDMNGVIPNLRNDSTLISPFTDAVKAALLIDCIWFGNSRFMPAVMEIEHSTGVTSGLTRMMGLQETIPSFRTRYVIVAPDEERHKVTREINRPQFRALEARYFPYSAVEELLWLCKRRNISGVTERDFH